MDSSKPVDSQQAASSTGRRRSSNTMFSSLQERRDASNPTRRQSLHDQKPEPGMIGKMWHTFTKGSSPPN